jgi:hypothetical protein
MNSEPAGLRLPVLLPNVAGLRFVQILEKDAETFPVY